jgi:hypothetical protein
MGFEFISGVDVGVGTGNRESARRDRDRPLERPGSAGEEAVSASTEIGGGCDDSARSDFISSCICCCSLFILVSSSFNFCFSASALASLAFALAAAVSALAAAVSAAFRRLLSGSPAAGFDPDPVGVDTSLEVGDAEPRLAFEGDAEPRLAFEGDAEPRLAFE